MVKKLFVLMLVLLLPVCALAQQVIDDADVFTVQEEELLAGYADVLESVTTLDMVIVTKDDVPTDYSGNYETTTVYAENYYENGGYGAGPNGTGFIILLDYNNGVVQVTTFGDMYTALPVDDLNVMINESLTVYGGCGNYDGTLCLMTSILDTLLAAKNEGMFSNPVAAVEPVNGRQVIDEADLLTEAQEQEIAAAIDKIESRHEVDFAVLVTAGVPTDDSEDMSGTMNFGYDYYDYNLMGAGQDASGMLYLIDLNNSVQYIVANGMMIDVVTDELLDAVFDMTILYLNNGDMSSAAIYAMEYAGAALDAMSPAGAVADEAASAAAAEPESESGLGPQITFRDLWNLLQNGGDGE